MTFWSTPTFLVKKKKNLHVCFSQFLIQASRRAQGKEEAFTAGSLGPRKPKHHGPTKPFFPAIGTASPGPGPRSMPAG